RRSTLFPYTTLFRSFVSNGRTDYYGSNEYKIAGPAEYPELTIADRCNIEQFKQGLQEHQQGKTNYLTFVEMCAEFGIEKWQMHIDRKSTRLNSSHVK